MLGRGASLRARDGTGARPGRSGRRGGVESGSRGGREGLARGVVNKTGSIPSDLTGVLRRGHLPRGRQLRAVGPFQSPRTSRGSCDLDASLLLFPLPDEEFQSPRTSRGSCDACARPGPSGGSTRPSCFNPLGPHGGPATAARAEAFAELAATFQSPRTSRGSCDPHSPRGLQFPSHAPHVSIPSDLTGVLRLSYRCPGCGCFRSAPFQSPRTSRGSCDPGLPRPACLREPGDRNRKPPVDLVENESALSRTNRENRLLIDIAAIRKPRHEHFILDERRGLRIRRPSPPDPET